MPAFSSPNTPNETLANALRSGLDLKNLAHCAEALDRGADPNANLGTVGSLLTYAIEAGFTEGAILLLNRGAHAEAPNAARRSPIFSAARMGDVRIGIELVERGADIEKLNADPFSVEGSTPLHEAARKSRVAFGAYLLEHGANIGARDTYGHSPLHKALSSDYADALAFTQMLLAAGADPGFTPPAPPPGYLTPFQSALANAQPRVTAYLLDHYEHLIEMVILGDRTWSSLVSKANLPLLMSTMAAKATQSIDAGLGRSTGDPDKSSRTKSFGPL